MELQFQKKQIPCLHMLLRRSQTQEQTQEIRVSDGMPDIGSVLCTWGQVILRGKEWQNDTLTVSGGTMVWVQYLPEEGGPPQTVKGWIPFQMHWNIPPTQHDGVMLAQCVLKSADARSTSARKLMVRTNVSALLHAMQRCQKDLFSPVSVPEDVQLHVTSYPVLLPAEAGEKAFSLEEGFPLQPAIPVGVLAANLQPEVTETRIMGDKLVFRGSALVNALFEAEDGSQYSKEFQLPFSQFCELDQDYGEDADAVIWPAVTTLETEMEDGQLQVKTGLVCQYVIRHRPVIEIVEDAYSPNRQVELQQQELELPGILESKVQKFHVSTASPADGLRVVNTQMFPQPVLQQVTDTGVTFTMPVQLQALYTNLDGGFKTHTEKWQESITLPTETGVNMEATLWQVGKTQGNMVSGNLQMQAELQLQTDALMHTGLPMVTGLVLGEFTEPDPDRPSLILCRAGERTLWQLAKTSGATVADIQRVNQLKGEPEKDMLLLIPLK